MAHIDYFFTVLSPWVYLSGDRLERIAAARGATLAHRPVDLAAVFAATGGVPLGKRHPSRVAYRAQELRRAVAETGAPFVMQPAHWPANAYAAHAAIAATEALGGAAGALTRRLARAIWAEERDVADPAVIADAVRETGGAPAALATADGAARVAANTAEALARGVFGAPFYVVGEERFWGRDRLDALDAHLATLG